MKISQERSSQELYAMDRETFYNILRLRAEKNKWQGVQSSSFGFFIVPILMLFLFWQGVVDLELWLVLMWCVVGVGAGVVFCVGTKKARETQRNLDKTIKEIKEV